MPPFTKRCLLVLSVIILIDNRSSALDPSSPVGMAAAAEKFLATLTPEQKKQATFDFDDRERLNWHYIPLEDKQSRKSTRKGLPLEALNADQTKAALELLRSGTSPDAFKLAQAIMEREVLIGELEQGKSWIRKTGWYFISVFGTPSPTGKWGWRWEGHHLALNFTVADGKVVGATPAFMGANPATVKSGPQKGVRLLPGAEDHARALFLKLDDKQKAIALQKEQFPDVEGFTPTAPVKEPVGIPAAQLTPEQREILQKLITHYLERLPVDVADAERKEIENAGIDKVYFAYTGEAAPDKPHTYRVHGPTFLIHYMCHQTDPVDNPGNHIHSVYRNLRHDFGIVAKP